jgi:uncharacterized protein involved in outer membrane biogenesis
MTILGLGHRRPRDGATDAATALAAGRRRPWLKRGIWAGAVVIVLAATYLAAGYYVVPRLLQNAADGWAQDTLHKPIRIGEIRFDPIRFTLDVQDLAVPADPRPMLAAEHIRVHFSVLSLLHGPYTFDEVRLERPLVRAVLRADHSLNLGDLAPKTAAKSGGGRAVRIGTLAIARGQVIYADDSLPGRPETTLSPVAFTLKDFQTDAAAGGAFAFRGRSELGERLTWTGALSTAPLHSRGRLEVSALRAQTIGAFLGPASPATLQGGLLDFATAYDLHSGQGGLKLDLTGADLDLSGLQAKAVSGLPADVAAAVDHARVRLDRAGLALGGKQGLGVQAVLPSFSVDGLSVAAPGQPVRVRSVALTDVSLDTAAHRLTAGALSVDGAELRVRRERDGRLSLVSLMPKASAAPAAPASAQTPPWSVHLASFALNRAVLQLDDAAVTPATHMVVSPIDLTVTNLDSDLSKPVGLRLDARMGGATLKVSGSATPGKANGELKVALSGLQLRPLLPYGPSLNDVDVTSGELSASGALRFNGADAAAISFDGQAAIDKVNVRQPSTNGLLFSWDAFRLEGLRYGPKGTTVEHAVLTTPVGRVVVMPDRTLNLAAVTGSAQPPQPPAPATTAPAAKAATQAPPPPPAATFTVKQLAIAGGTMEFADLSIDPNFQARIQALQGSLSNISNKPDSVVGIDLSGQVIDQFSPATIKGSMDLSGFDRQTDMHLTFRNIELPMFDPYSGLYAGYAIAKGKLTTELTYKIDHRMLKADHHVVIDQLQWGAATDSKQKAPIPVRLATALLKDKNGVIDLDVPVTGSMDDPKFKVWPIIWQIVRNTLEKAAAAPFRMIGGLFAGADKAEFVDFEPGSASLPPDAGKALSALGKGLAGKQEISLDVPAGPGLALDATAMANRRLDEALIAQKAKPASVAALKPDERLARLKALYKTQFHQNPEFPKPAPPAAGQAAPAKVSPEQRQADELAWLQDRLRPAFTPSPGELQALGAARAKAIRDALLAESGVDPMQVFMTPQDTASVEGGHTRLVLKLQ